MLFPENSLNVFSRKFRLGTSKGLELIFMSQQGFEHGVPSHFLHFCAFHNKLASKWVYPNTKSNNHSMIIEFKSTKNELVVYIKECYGPCYSLWDTKNDWRSKDIAMTERTFHLRQSKIDQWHFLVGQNFFLTFIPISVDFQLFFIP